MVSNFKDLKRILTVSSECGDERAFAEMAKELLSEYTGDVSIDRMNNVIAYIGDKSKKKIMLTAHSDEISAIVCDINESGFVRIKSVGGIDRRVLLSSEATVNGLNGIFCCMPPHLMKPGEASKVPDFTDLYLDFGMTADEVKTKIHIGDRVYFKSPVTELMNGRIASKALDDKLCCYTILVALKKLKKLILHNELDCCIAVLFATQEEVGSRGATVGTYAIAPEEAIALDVTFAKQPDGGSYALGEGSVIEHSAIFDQKLTRQIEKCAKDSNLKYSIEANAISLGTDADTISIVGDGVKTGLISVPIRYMHTPVEVCDLADVENAADILVAYLKTYEIGG